MVGWLLPFVFSLAILIGIGVLILAVVFLRIEALQGSLPDIKCETDVNIFFSFFRKMKILNSESLSW